MPLAAAISLILVLLATGLDLASISPCGYWCVRDVTNRYDGDSRADHSMARGCVGGYGTGRLRTKWVGTHTHEVFLAIRRTLHRLGRCDPARDPLWSRAHCRFGAGAHAGAAAAAAASNIPSGGLTNGSTRCVGVA